MIRATKRIVLAAAVMAWAIPGIATYAQTSTSPNNGFSQLSPGHHEACQSYIKQINSDNRLISTDNNLISDDKTLISDDKTLISEQDYKIDSLNKKLSLLNEKIKKLKNEPTKGVTQ